MNESRIGKRLLTLIQGESPTDATGRRGFLTAVTAGIFSSWSQNVSGFTIGDQYTLSFMLAGQTTNLFWPVTVQIIDTSTQSQNFVGPASSSNYFRTWQTFTMTFTANAATEQVLFTSVTARNIGLDNVSITQTPEPGNWSLFGAGIAVLALRAATHRAKSRLRV